MKTLNITTAHQLVRDAMDHVQDFFPDVSVVTYEKGTWTYSTINGYEPDFDDLEEMEFNFDLLNDAAREVANDVQYIDGLVAPDAVKELKN
ncbi:hypothetical protein ACMG5I_03180 [Escherichia coli]|uniref:hypothetical protein n=1 Tax=Escherichia coli TaxID=562 RepID=UPI0039BF31D3